MRKDMAKVIVERARMGHRDRYDRGGRTCPLEDEDGAPLRARMRLRRPRKTKMLNENLAPLQRFLEKQAGRPWDKVYSEISAHLRASNAVQQHVRDHIEDFVAVKTRMAHGKVMAVDRNGAERPVEQTYRRLYVHPRTGLLRRVPRKQRAAR